MFVLANHHLRILFPLIFKSGKKGEKLGGDTHLLGIEPATQVMCPYPGTVGAWADAPSHPGRAGSAF